MNTNIKDLNNKLSQLLEEKDNIIIRLTEINSEISEISAEMRGKNKLTINNLNKKGN